MPKDKKPIKADENEVEKIQNIQIPTLKDRYELLIKARNFHYENYNKWMTYFYVIIGAIFLGLFNIVSKNERYLDCYKNEITLICALGFIVSLCWYLANKGYYYWNINFINLVNHYEKNIFKFEENERVYFTFANKNVQNNYLSPIHGANISTSKISIFLSYIFTFCWGYSVFYILLFNYFLSYWICIICCLISFFTIVVLSILAGKYLKSNHTAFPDLKIKFLDWVDIEKTAKL